VSGEQAGGGETVLGDGAPRAQTREQDPDALARRYREVSRRYPARREPLLQRPLDVALSTLGLLVTAPVVLGAMLLTRLTGGPALYHGHRVGRGGVLFTMYKIRTLAPDAERRMGAIRGVELTRLSATEATWLGSLLRATKIDELPQLWNVLRGEMSLVGPRPVRPAFLLTLIDQVPAYWQRLAVRPGLTGLAQLRMTRETSWEEKMAHDLEWVADCSISLYVRVLTATCWLWLGRPLRTGHRDLRLP
jgi:lipopolysaccharide/colanic/teichoic acid biosynthesis glycosyltransferase